MNHARAVAVFVAVSAHAVVFFVPVQASAVSCTWTEPNDWVDCRSSEATIVERTLLSERGVANNFVEGKLALKLRVSYSSGSKSWSRFDCAKMSVTVRYGAATKTYRHVVPYSSGVADYIEDTVPYLFSPPFRESDISVQSTSCQVPKAQGNEEEERERQALEEERERLALEEERERLALEEERERLALEAERQRMEEEARLAQARRERERQRLAQIRQEREQERERQRLARERQWQEEQRRLAALHRTRELERLEEEQAAAQSSGNLLGVASLIGGVALGLSGHADAANSALNALEQLATMRKSTATGSASAATVDGSCAQAQRRAEQHARRAQDSQSARGMCDAARHYVSTLQTVRRELASGGCPAQALRSYEQAINQARETARASCN